MTKTPLIRAMRTVKKETLKLISTWVEKSNDSKMVSMHAECVVSLLHRRHCVCQVCESFIPPLLDAVLGDYQRNVPVAREPEVLSTMTTVVNKLEVHNLHSLFGVSECLCACVVACLLACLFVMLEDDAYRSIACSGLTVVLS